MSTENLLTAAGAAVRLGITEERMRQFCAEGRIGAKLGGRWVITTDELRQFKKIPRRTGRPPEKDKP